MPRLFVSHLRRNLGQALAVKFSRATRAVLALTALAWLCASTAHVDRQDTTQQTPAMFSADQFGKLDLVPNQSTERGQIETLGASFERYEPMSILREDDRFRVLGRSIGRLQMYQTQWWGSTETGVCTAALISPDRIITNHHCIPGDSRSRVDSALVTFNYLTLSDPDSQTLEVDPVPVETDPALDYSILKLKSQPTKVASLAPVPLDVIRSAQDRESLFIIHHPVGQPQRLSRAFCRAHPDKAVAGTELRHQCDTLSGSSGSLIFAQSDFAVVGIHHRGGLTPSDPSSFNRGTDAAALKQKSGLLAALAQQRAAEKVAADTALGARDNALRVCREVEGMRSIAVLAAMETQYQGTPAGACVTARIAEVKAETAAADRPAETEKMKNLMMQVERKARVAAEREAKTEANQMFVLLGEQVARAEAERKAKEEAERKAKAEAEAKQKVALLAAQEARAAAERAEAERKAKEEAERKAREAAERFAPVKTFRDCADCPEMVVVPAGKFLMGSSPEEIAALTKEYGDYYKGEGPQRTVTIPKPFAVGKYEVTFAEWDACVTAGGCQHKPEASWGRGRQPVIRVSSDDAKAYAAWLSKTTGQTYRLLSESEWEYAARAGTTTPFAFGATISADQANYNGNFTYGNGKTGQDREKTVEVGSFPANDFGLHDMHGNVWEWVEDCWIDSYRNAPTDSTARTTACSDDGRRVARGGSWDYGPDYLRSAGRGRATSVDRLNFIGFRVGRTLD